MFTKNFYTRLWEHWILPQCNGDIAAYETEFPSGMYGTPANGNPIILSELTTPSSGAVSNDREAIARCAPSLACGYRDITLNNSPSTSSSTSLFGMGQYVPSNIISQGGVYGIKNMTFSETAYNENTFYDQTVANNPISNLGFSTRPSQSDTKPIYDSTTDSIKRTFSYTLTNNNENAITIRSISGTKTCRTRSQSAGQNVSSYLLIWAVNLDNPVELLAGESATLTITYRWNNCTPGSQASPYSISASIE